MRGGGIRGRPLYPQEEADKLPVITDDYPMKNLNKGVVHVNTTLAREYLKVKV